MPPSKHLPYLPRSIGDGETMRHGHTLTAASTRAREARKGKNTIPNSGEHRWHQHTAADLSHMNTWRVWDAPSCALVGLVSAWHPACLDSGLGHAQYFAVSQPLWLEWVARRRAQRPRLASDSCRRLACRCAPPFFAVTATVLQRPALAQGWRAEIAAYGAARHGSQSRDAAVAGWRSGAH